MGSFVLEPLVSVIMPAWNAAPFLSRALDAALEQQGVNVEVIVVDDGSTDGTHAIASARAAADTRIKVLAHETSMGPSAARNTALAEARGEWVAVLDADDAQHPHRLERMVRVAAERELDVLADNMVMIDGSSGATLGSALSPEFVGLDGQVSFEAFLAHDWPGRNLPFLGAGTAKPIFRREFLACTGLKYDPHVRLGEDMLLYAQALLLGARFGVIRESMYLYTVRKNSESRRRRPTLELVDVNTRIRRAAYVQGASADRLRLLDRRGRALQFQVLTWAVKQGYGRMAFELARELGPAAFIQLSVETALRRTRARNRRIEADHRSGIPHGLANSIHITPVTPERR